MAQLENIRKIQQNYTDVLHIKYFSHFIMTTLNLHIML